MRFFVAIDIGAGVLAQKAAAAVVSAATADQLRATAG